MPKLKFIGPKPEFTDTYVAKTNVRWAFHGDVQEVPTAAAAILLGHPDMWELAEDEEAEPTPIPPAEPAKRHNLIHFKEGEGSVFRLQDTESGEVTDLSEMDDNAVKSFARRNNIKADLRKRADELRAGIVASVVFDGEPKE